ncbi:MAG: HAMP domain-containing histidine kinase [Thermoanaerobaculia bacterium]|nr:HAMP domain-containing histidine kinase [Thermoanaerobaculia bacterium]
MTRRTTPIFIIYLIYTAALAMTTALLVFWVLVVHRFTPEINELIGRVGGVEWNHFHWFIQSTGAGLFFLVIVALTYLLAITLSERRYRVKQDHFLSNVTHELKSPVAAIQLQAQTLQHTDLNAREVAQCADLIVEQTARIGTLVDNLLETGRLASSMSSELRPIRLGEFFREYQEIVRNRFDFREIDLKVEIQSRSVVMATSESLQRILDNLIDNALRFTHAGGRILLRVSDREGETEIVVSDDGVGIPKTELTRVFDRFHRLQREVDERRKGTGLGLNIVRGLVKELRGQIRAISGDGQPGTRFEIRLPKASEESAPHDSRKYDEQETRS